MSLGGNSYRVTVQWDDSRAGGAATKNDCDGCQHMSQGLTRMQGTAQGFTLIELMIAMVLGLLVLGAALAVFQSNQKTFSANEGQNRVQENARIAYEMMGKDIRRWGVQLVPVRPWYWGVTAIVLRLRAPIGEFCLRVDHHFGR